MRWMWKASATCDDIEGIKKASDGKIDFTIGAALDICGGSLEFEKVAKFK